VEVGLLRLFYSFIQRVDESALSECWPLLLSLLKEGLQINLTPPAVFLLLTYLCFAFNPPLSLLSDALHLRCCTAHLWHDVSVVCPSVMDVLWLNGVG